LDFTVESTGKTTGETLIFTVESTGKTTGETLIFTLLTSFPCLLGRGGRFTQKFLSDQASARICA